MFTNTNRAAILTQWVGQPYLSHKLCSSMALVDVAAIVMTRSVLGVLSLNESDSHIVGRSLDTRSLKKRSKRSVTLWIGGAQGCPH